MARLTFISPATVTDALAIGPRYRIGRGMVALQVHEGESVAVRDGGRTIAVGMLYPVMETVREFCLVIDRQAARPHLTACIRFARLTFGRLAQNHVEVVSFVNRANVQGQRIARLAGFEPEMADERQWQLWRWEPTHGTGRETDLRRRRGRGRRRPTAPAAEGGERTPAAAAQSG
ncbi:MAG: hypothetical protein KDJ77_20095 [Rhodobiaceae bacterium]|nr:hypothetical protein [Rhodobiaceae bacterium]